MFRMTNRILFKKIKWYEITNIIYTRMDYTNTYLGETFGKLLYDYSKDIYIKPK